jgi:hypothetical protein
MRHEFFLVCLEPLATRHLLHISLQLLLKLDPWSPDLNS